MEQIDQVELIKRSMRCFSFGLVGILPGIGVPFAVIALWDFLHISQYKGTSSNPAERLLRWGAFSAIVGLLLTMFLAALGDIQLWLGR